MSTENTPAKRETEKERKKSAHSFRIMMVLALLKTSQNEQTNKEMSNEYVVVFRLLKYHLQAHCICEIVYHAVAQKRPNV